MKALIARHKVEFADKAFIWSLVMSLAFIVASLTINYYASLYATKSASSHVTDIILSNIPVYDVDWLFVYGPIIFWVIVTVVCLYHPRRIPFMLKSVALFIIVRSLFITLTHIGPYPDAIPIEFFKFESFPDFTAKSHQLFSGSGNLFFSGHTGLPFLLALVFWKDLRMRVFCLAAAVLFGVVVLLGHLHYTIDVLSAFFITYSIYRISEWLFKKDRTRFLRV